MPTLHNPLMEGGPLDQELRPGTCFPVWPHRRVSPTSTVEEQERTQIEDPDVLRVLKRLDELEKISRPMNELTSAKGKDLAASEALRCAGELTTRLAGWAIAHQFGLAAKGLQSVQEPLPKAENYQLFLQQQILVDSHEHERVGAWEPRGVDQEFTRKSLANLVRSNSGGWPDWFCEKTLESIEALEYGEVRPMFSPVSAGRKRDYTLMTLQLSAIAMVTFRRGAYAMKKEDALNEVGNELHVSPHTLRSWKVRLQKEFGRLRVGEVIAEADFHASCVRSDIERGRLTQTVYDVSRHSAFYDAHALAELGKQYKAALRRDAQKSPLRISK
jgi:hypothetical protein